MFYSLLFPLKCSGYTDTFFEQKKGESYSHINAGKRAGDPESAPPRQLLGLTLQTIGWLNHWGFPGGSAVKNPPASVRDAGSFPGSARSPGEKEPRTQNACFLSCGLLSGEAVNVLLSPESSELHASNPTPPAPCGPSPGASPTPILL